MIPFHKITLDFLEIFTLRIHDLVPLLCYLGLPSIRQIFVELPFHLEKNEHSLPFLAPWGQSSARGCDFGQLRH